MTPPSSTPVREPIRPEDRKGFGLAILVALGGVTALAAALLAMWHATHW